MVNLRYHIVSLTAVFLALGIGLTLGSSFLDRVTVDTLNNQLTALEGQIGETRAENRDLGRRAGALADRDALLGEQLGERVLRGAWPRSRSWSSPARAPTRPGWSARCRSSAPAVPGCRGPGGSPTGSRWRTRRRSPTSPARWDSPPPTPSVSAAAPRSASPTCSSTRPRRRWRALRGRGARGPIPVASRRPRTRSCRRNREQDGPGGPDGAEPELLAALRAAGYVEYQQASSDAEGPVRLRRPGCAT
jgi:hypothetical protein